MPVTREVDPPFHTTILDCAADAARETRRSSSPDVGPRHALGREATPALGIPTGRPKRGDNHSVPTPEFNETDRSTWFDEFTRRLAEDYVRARNRYVESHGASNQEAGHIGEAGWRRVLEQWLPPQYHVGTRKYLVADSRAGAALSKEVDLIVYHPSYPQGFRDQPHVLASGVVAAFSVKMTLDAAGIREACESAAELRALMPTPDRTLRDELISPILFGVLAHSHAWQGATSRPAANIERVLQEYAPRNPRESVDVVCVADLGCWTRLTLVMLDHLLAAIQTQSGGAVVDSPHVSDGLFSNEADPPLGVLVAHVIGRFAKFDPTLRPIATALKGLLPSGSSRLRVGHRWPLEDALSAETLEWLAMSS